MIFLQHADVKPSVEMFCMQCCPFGHRAAGDEVHVRDVSGHDPLIYMVCKRTVVAFARLL